MANQLFDGRSRIWRHGALMLKAAITGEFTATWRAAKQVPQSKGQIDILAGIFTDRPKQCKADLKNKRQMVVTMHFTHPTSAA